MDERQRAEFNKLDLKLWDLSGVFGRKAERCMLYVQMNRIKDGTHQICYRARVARREEIPNTHNPAAFA